MERKVLIIGCGLMSTLLAACSGSPTAPGATASDSTGVSTQRSIADEPIRGGLGTGGVPNSCTTEKVSLGYANPNNGKVDLGWYRLGGATGYEGEVEVLDPSAEINRYLPTSHKISTDGNAGVMTTLQGLIPNTYRYRVRMKATVQCGRPGTWSDWMIFSVDGKTGEPEKLTRTESWPYWPTQG